jgi:LacI family transcriptional regulator
MAEELAYRPDPMLTKLANYRRGLKSEASSIAYLINMPSRELWSKEHSEVRFLAGAKQRAEELGYRLDEIEGRKPGLTAKRLSKMLETRNYKGLILAHPKASRGHIRLDWSQFRAVKIGHSLIFPRLHCVENNQYQIVQLTVRVLRRKGYHRIGLAMNAVSDEIVNHWWKAGYLVEIDRPIFDQIPMLITKDWNFSTFKEWFLRHRPEVVISVHLSVLDWLKKMGLRVPEDVGFVDLDCNDLSGKRTGIYQRHECVGAAAIDALHGLIVRGERGIPDSPQLILVEGKWIEGTSIEPRSGGDVFMPEAADDLSVKGRPRRSRQPAVRNREANPPFAKSAGN